jgi:hypothetical protein
MQSTNVTYRMEDGTGMIDVKQWIDAEQGGSGSEYPYIPLYPITNLSGPTRTSESLDNSSPFTTSGISELIIFVW